MEIKGRDLDEDSVSRVVTLCERFPLFLAIASVEMSNYRLEWIAEHQRAQAEFLVSGSVGTGPRFRSDIQKISADLLALSPQLYLQLVTLNALIVDVIRAAILYFPDRCPSELGHFKWRLDRKSINSESFERLWQLLVMPYLQTTFAKDPMIELKNHDYSYFARFSNPPVEEPPEHLKELLGSNLRGSSGPYVSTDLRKLLSEDLDVVDSAQDGGIQLADVLANAFRRACAGRLRRHGWRNMGRLMLRPEGANRSVRLIDLSTSDHPGAPREYWHVIQELNAKSSLPFVVDKTNQSLE